MLSRKEKRSQRKRCVLCEGRMCVCVCSPIFTADFPLCILTSGISSALMVFIYPSILQQLSPLINPPLSLSLSASMFVMFPPCKIIRYVNAAEMQTCMKNLPHAAPEPASDEPRSEGVACLCFISDGRLKGSEARAERREGNEGRGAASDRETVGKETRSYGKQKMQMEMKKETKEIEKQERK